MSDEICLKILTQLPHDLSLICKKLGSAHVMFLGIIDTPIGDVTSVFENVVSAGHLAKGARVGIVIAERRTTSHSDSLPRLCDFMDQINKISESLKDLRLGLSATQMVVKEDHEKARLVLKQDHYETIRRNFDLTTRLLRDFEPPFTSCIKLWCVHLARDQPDDPPHLEKSPAQNPNSNILAACKF